VANSFSTIAELEASINLRMEIALDNTLERLLQELQLIIDRVVYGWQSPSSNPWGWGENGGNRTHEFYESWQRTKPIMLGNLLEGEIYQAIELMNFTKMNGGYAHEDAENLANIIETGDGYNFGQAEGMGREFWNEFEQFCVVNIESIFKSECIKVGLPVTSSITATFT